MASVSGLSADQLRTKISELKAQGKTESTSKSLGKYVDALKVLEPQKYGAETVQSATAKLRVSTTPETQAQLGIAPLATSERTTGAAAGMFGIGRSSRLDLNKMYTEAMGGADITGLEKQIADKKTALTQAMTNINDNPYYSEATRTGTLAKLQETANREISDLQDQLTLKKADVQTRLNIATQQYNIDSQEYQNNLNRLNTLISTGAIAGANANDISQISQATGISTEMVKSIMEKVRLGNRQLSTATNDAGDVTIFDANTGQVVNTIKGIGNRQTAGTEKQTKAQAIQTLKNDLEVQANLAGDKKLSPTAYLAARSAAVEDGISYSEFDQMFAEKYAYGSLTDQAGDIDQYKLTTEK